MASEGSRASREVSGGNQIHMVDVERQATPESVRTHKSKRKPKSTNQKSGLSNSKSGGGGLSGTSSRPGRKSSDGGDNDDRDLGVRMPAFPQKYTMTRGLSPYWSTTRGIFTIVGIVLVVIGAIVGGAVGGLVGNRDASATEQVTGVGVSGRRNGTSTTASPSSSFSVAPTPTPELTLTPTSTPGVQGRGFIPGVGPRTADSTFVIRGGAAAAAAESPTPTPTPTPMTTIERFPPPV